MQLFRYALPAGLRRMRLGVRGLSTAVEVAALLAAHEGGGTVATLLSDALRSHPERVSPILRYAYDSSGPSCLGPLLENVLSSTPSDQILQELQELVVVRRTPLTSSQSHSLVSSVLSKQGPERAKAFLLTLCSRSLPVYSASFLLLYNSFLSRSDWSSVESLLDAQRASAVALSPDEYKMLFQSLEREDTPGSILLHFVRQCHSFGVFLDASVYQRCISSCVESELDPSVTLSMIREMSANHYDVPIPLQFQLLQFYAKLGRSQLPIVEATLSSLDTLGRETIVKHALFNRNFLYLQDWFLSPHLPRPQLSMTVQQIVESVIEHQIDVPPYFVRHLSTLSLSDLFPAEILGNFHDPRYLDLSQACLRWVGSIDFSAMSKYCHFLKKLKQFSLVREFLERCGSLNPSLLADPNFQSLQRFYALVTDGSDVSSLSAESALSPEEYRIVLEQAAQRSDWDFILRLYRAQPENSPQSLSFRPWALLAAISQGDAETTRSLLERLTACSAPLFGRILSALSQAQTPPVTGVQVLTCVRRSIAVRETPLFLADFLESCPSEFQSLFRDILKSEYPIVEPLASAFLRVQPSAAQRQSVYETLQRHPRYQPGIESLHSLLSSGSGLALLREWRSQGRKYSSESYELLLSGCSNSAQAEEVVKELVLDPIAIPASLLIECIRRLRNSPRLSEYTERLLQK